MKVWVTKYALSAGIFPVEGEYTEDQMYFSEEMPERGFRLFLRKADICEFLDEALKRGEEIREKRLASLHKQIEKTTKRKIKVTSRPS